MARPTLSVAVVTYERLTFLLRCLESLRSERDDILDVVVIDASKEPTAHHLDSLNMRVTYVHAPELAGWMTRSRNRALLFTRGDVVAFLDDDVVVQDGWASAIRHVYDRLRPDAVVGRTRNGILGEEVYEPPIGRLLPDGRLTEGFAAERESELDVDHGIGANMSFTRSVLRDLGGFRDDYPGTALREDTDMFLRISRRGGRAVFAPAAVVDHLPAPHVRGKRFDSRYKLYGRRNHIILLARHSGVGSVMMRRWVVGQFREIRKAGGPTRRVQRLGMVLAGLAFGGAALAREGRWGPMTPERTGPAADEVRQALSRSQASEYNS